MAELLTSVVRTAGLMALMLAFVVPAHAQSRQSRDDAATQTASIERVQAKYVCMITNKLYKDVQIPVPFGEKTYYGCCRGCVTELKMNPESRMAADPVTGAKVDKATAVIGALPDGTVRYFESGKTLRQFAASAESEDPNS